MQLLLEVTGLKYKAHYYIKIDNLSYYSNYDAIFTQVKQARHSFPCVTSFWGEARNSKQRFCGSLDKIRLWIL